MYLKKFIYALVILLFALVSFAANTTTVGSSGTVIEITGLDADWTWSTALASQPNYIKNGLIQRITFYPTAASDRMIVRDGGIDNATFFDSGAVSGSDDPRTMFWVNPQRANLVIDISDCTLPTPAGAKVVIHLKVR